MIQLKDFRDLIRDASLTPYSIKMLFLVDDALARLITRHLGTLRGHNIDLIADWRQGEELRTCGTGSEPDTAAGAVEDWNVQGNLLVKSVERLSN